MTLDQALLASARDARERLLQLQHDAEVTRADYHDAIRRLHAEGGSMREIADALGLSHQRVHQLVDTESGESTPPRPRAFAQLFSDARRALDLAYEAARELHHNYVGTEHLLLGLLGTEAGLAHRVLTTAGLTKADTEAAVVRMIGEAAATPPSGPPSLTPRAKKVLDIAVREARRVKSSHARSEHVLLAIAREGKGVAARILAEHSVGYDRVRDDLGKAGLTCSFCGNNALTARKVIAGPGVFICDECVDRAEPDRSRAGVCAFCTRTSDALFSGPDVAICPDCVELCQQILAEDTT